MRSTSSDGACACGSIPATTAAKRICCSRPSITSPRSGRRWPRRLRGSPRRARPFVFIDIGANVGPVLALRRGDGAHRPASSRSSRSPGISTRLRFNVDANPGLPIKAAGAGARRGGDGEVASCSTGATAAARATASPGRGAVTVRCRPLSTSSGRGSPHRCAENRCRGGRGQSAGAIFSATLRPRCGQASS